MSERMPGAYVLDASGNPLPDMNDPAMAERIKTTQNDKNTIAVSPEPVTITGGLENE